MIKRNRTIGTNVKLKNIDITQRTPGQVIALVCDVEHATLQQVYWNRVAWKHIQLT